MILDYAAHKAALTNLTTALSEEFALRGVRVNAVSPGPVRTPGWTDDGRMADAMAAASGATREEGLGPEAQWITGTDPPDILVYVEEAHNILPASIGPGCCCDLPSVATRLESDRVR